MKKDRRGIITFDYRINDMNEKEKIIKTRRSVNNLTSDEKWNLLSSYVKLDKGNQELADEYSIAKKSLEKFITTVYKRLQQAKETKLLMTTETNPDLFQILKAKNIDSEHINQLFLDKLSEPNDPILTDNELLFCEYFLEYGDDVKALEESKLSIGLKGDKTHTLAQYKEACHLRSFYLKKKPNVSSYIMNLKKDKLKEVQDGKLYIQQKLVTLLDRIENMNDSKLLPQYLKAMEQLARSYGAFDDKMTVTNVDGDDVLDSILLKAKAINEKDNQEELIH